MTIQEAYLNMFNTLSDHYLKEKNYSLASLLSDMDPNIFLDGNAADPATYNDWYNIIKSHITDGQIKDEDVVLALREFLIYYQKEFGYDFSVLLQIL